MCHTESQERTDDILHEGDDGTHDARTLGAADVLHALRLRRLARRLHCRPCLTQAGGKRATWLPAQQLRRNRTPQHGDPVRVVRCGRRTHRGKEVRADHIEILHRRPLCGGDVEIWLVKVARRRLIDRIDSVARIDQPAHRLGGRGVLRQRTPRERHAEQASDQAILCRHPRSIELGKTDDRDGNPLCTIRHAELFEPYEKSAVRILRIHRIAFRRLCPCGKHLVVGEQKDLLDRTLLRHAQKRIQTTHRNGGVALQSVDEQIQILNGKHLCRLRAVHLAVIRMNPLRRTFSLHGTETIELPPLLCVACTEQLFQIARKPDEHRLFCPCTHVIILFLRQSASH